MRSPPIITASQAIFAVDYRGISVAQADQLRTTLRQADAVFRVVKNSLTERAAQRPAPTSWCRCSSGPTALTFVRGDAAAAAKAVADFTRATQLMAFKGGLMDGAALSSSDVTAISRLPSRDVLYGQLVGLIASPIVGAGADAERPDRRACGGAGRRARSKGSRSGGFRGDPSPVAQAEAVAGAEASALLRRGAC